MTEFALQRERTVLKESLYDLIGKCESSDFSNILRGALARIKNTQSSTLVRKRLSDVELELILADNPVFDETTYHEPTDEEWKMIATANSGRIIKGLEKWL